MDCDEECLKRYIFKMMKLLIVFYTNTSELHLVNVLLLHLVRKKKERGKAYKNGFDLINKPI